VAAGTMKEFLKQSRLDENKGGIPDEDGILRNLLTDHEAIVRALREDVERADEEYKAVEAADFLTAVIEKHNKMAWMLRSFLPSTGGNVKTKNESDDALVGSRR
jgi:starvation-inducible DNA-binding protein